MYLASSMTPARQNNVSDWKTNRQYFTQGVCLLTKIGITRKSGAPTDKSGVGELARGYAPETNRVDDAGIAKLGLSIDDAEGNEVCEVLHRNELVSNKLPVSKRLLSCLRCARPA